MAYFSDSDIDEAKRRVKDMQKKASRYAESTPAPDVKEPEKPNEKSERKPDLPPKADAPEVQNDNSQLIILALVMLLSREGADNMLLLALLYLLF